MHVRVLQTCSVIRGIGFEAKSLDFEIHECHGNVEIFSFRLISGQRQVALALAVIGTAVLYFTENGLVNTSSDS